MTIDWEECCSKRILKKNAKGDEFDNIRKVRNAVNYYGKEISAEEAAGFIASIKSLRKFILNLVV